ncbi:hypothetical protein, partial [Aquitalea palustris]|uniref:hypothetical protein n=1 Tax=Aquitalea palustris TaxID=2480983 RepID=UPI001F23FF20
MMVFIVLAAICRSHAALEWPAVYCLATFGRIYQYPFVWHGFVRRLSFKRIAMKDKKKYRRDIA